MAMMTLAMEHNPEAGSEWPMLDFTEPSSNGVVRSLQKKSAMALTSCGSPTCKHTSVTRPIVAHLSSGRSGSGAYLGAGAVRLHVNHVLRPEARLGESLLGQAALHVSRGEGDALHFAAVGVHARAAHGGV